MKPYLPLFVLVVVLALGLAACSGTEADAPVTPATPAHGLEPLPEGRWTELARALVQAEDLSTANRITREVLARGGMATTDGERIVMKAIGPATPYAMTALEVRNLSMEARNRDTAFRLHASEFAHFLNTFAWDMGGSSGSDIPSWLTKDEMRAIEDERDARIDAAEEAVLAVARDDELAAQRNIAELEAAQAQQPSRETSLALSQARRAAREAARDNTRRANQVRQRAQREAWAERKVGPNYRSGETLLALLDTWVREAAKHPDDPESFTPLFLAEMARLQQAPFDLLGSYYMRPSRGTDLAVDLRGGPRVDDYRMTLLEMQLFLAAFQRGHSSAPTASRASALPSRFAANIVDALLPPAHAQGLSQCDAVKEILGGSSPGEANAVGWALNESAGNAWKLLGEKFGISEGALSKLGNASKILRVVIQYANTEVQVRAEQGMVHKPASAGSDGHGNRHAWFTASAGVDPEDLEDYDDAYGDQEGRINEILNRCFGSLELPSLQSTKEIADAAENWRVQWEIRPLHPEHLNISMSDPDNEFVKRNSVQREMKLKRASPAHAEARLKAQVAPEQASRGEVAVAHSTVIAKVVDTGTPGFGELVNAIKGIFGGGMTDITVDLAAGWMKHILVPRAAALQTIEYHCLDKQYIRRVSNPVADGRPQPRTRDHCVVPAEPE